MFAYVFSLIRVPHFHFHSKFFSPWKSRHSYSQMGKVFKKETILVPKFSISILPEYKIWLSWLFWTIMLSFVSRNLLNITRNTFYISKIRNTLRNTLKNVWKTHSVKEIFKTEKIIIAVIYFSNPKDHCWYE